MKKVIGLDSLRFVLAFIVLLGHGTVPSFSNELIAQSKIVYYLDALMKLAQPTGVAAVMAFFIISGFVIHYPYSQGKVINIPEFYMRRALRICLPAMIALAIYHFTFGLFMGVAWSLLCELIYYFLYPFILKYKQKYMKHILILSFIMSYAVSMLYMVFTKEYNGDFHQSGLLLTWVVGLPVWLLGLVLADQYQNILNKASNLTYSKLWAWRMSTWMAASFCLILRFHFHIAYPYTLPIFSILVYFWIKQEIDYYKNKQENKILGYGGLMSYSLYLVHAYIIFLVEYFSKAHPLSEHWWLSLFAITLSLLFSWIFYLAVEHPSHKLAQAIKIKTKGS